MIFYFGCNENWRFIKKTSVTMIPPSLHRKFLCFPTIHLYTCDQEEGFALWLQIESSINQKVLIFLLTEKSYILEMEFVYFLLCLNGLWFLLCLHSKFTNRKLYCKLYCLLFSIASINFKVLLLSFFFFSFYLVIPHSMWDLSSLSRHQTHTPYIGSAES